MTRFDANSERLRIWDFWLRKSKRLVESRPVMLDDSQTVDALRNVFDEIVAHKKSRIGPVGQLCGIASRLDVLECRADSEDRLHVFVNGVEVFVCTFQHGISDFRNLLAVMAGFAKEFADETKNPGLNVYGLDCVIKPPKDVGEGASAVRLETMNTGGEQWFRFSKVKGV